MIDLTRRNSLATLLAVSAGGASASPVHSNAAGASVLSVADFGAVGDGRADDTDAFRIALERGSCVLVPPAMRQYRITRTLAMRRPGQRIVGFGALSRIVLDPMDSAQGNLLVTQHEGCGFIGLHLVPAEDTSSLFSGWGIAIADTRRALVQDCSFSGMRHGGVLLSDSNDCKVLDNVFEASVVKGDGSERQAATGYDILVAGTSSRNMISRNHCLSGVGTAIGCQTVTRGKSQRGNIISENIISNYPCYGIMAYLSSPEDRIEQITIEGNSIDDISGRIYTDGKTRFYGAGIYLQTANDVIVSRNRISRTNIDRRLPFSGSAVPAAIGISGYGNVIVSENIIDTCHHGVASIQTTARPRRGDGTIIADNLIRNCDGAGVWLADGVSGTVHDNRLTALPGKGTHGILVRRFDSEWMDGFLIRGNELTDFAVGIEVSGDKVPRAEISSNSIRGNQGNAIHSSAATTVVSRNRIEGNLGISLAPSAACGFCSENIIRTSGLAVIDDGGSGVRVQDNIVPAGASFSTSMAQALKPGALPRLSAKRWFRKLDASPISGFAGGYEGQKISILAEAPFVMKHGQSIRLDAGADLQIGTGRLISLVLIEGVWRQTS